MIYHGIILIRNQNINFQTGGTIMKEGKKLEFKMEKATCAVCGDKRFKVKVYYDGDGNRVKSDLCPICETDANIIKESVFSKIRRLANSIDSLEMLKRIGRHFLGYLSEKDKDALKEKKVTDTQIKNVVSGKTNFVNFIKKHEDCRLLVLRKILEELKQKGKLYYFPIEHYEAGGEISDFTTFSSNHLSDIIKAKPDLHHGLNFLNTHFVFEETRKAEQNNDLQRIKELYVEAQSRDLKKVQDRFVYLFQKFNESQCIRKAAYWEQFDEEDLKEKTVEDLINHFN